MNAQDAREDGDHLPIRGCTKVNLNTMVQPDICDGPSDDRTLL
jgi:hypothetical protein